VIFWETPGNDYNSVWHELFEDSPLLIGAPRHWNRHEKFNAVNRHRAMMGQQGEIQSQEGLNKGADTTHCDYEMYFPRHCGSEMCRGFDFSRETWLLRLAREPSAQEFFMLLRCVSDSTRLSVSSFSHDTQLLLLLNWHFTGHSFVNMSKTRSLPLLRRSFLQTRLS
jgi:hypothetical protein